MKILIVTDAWPPVTSGVVRTYQTTIRHLEMMGHRVDVITPDQFFTVRCPTDNQQRLALYAGRKTGRLIEASQPDAIHVATEGPLGLAGRNWCVKHSVPFTTSYTTKLPEYFRARGKIPTAWTYAVMRWFHQPAAGVMVSTDTLHDELSQSRFSQPGPLGPGRRSETVSAPVEGLFVGSSTDFDVRGPGRRGKELGEILAARYARNEIRRGRRTSIETADAQISPTRGLSATSKARSWPAIMPQPTCLYFPAAPTRSAWCCSKRWPAVSRWRRYPVAGPLDVVGNSGVGVLDEDLGAAVRKALQISPAECRRYAQRFGWPAVTQQFLSNLRPIREAARRMAA